MTFDWTPPRSGRTPQCLPRTRKLTLPKAEETEDPTWGDTGMRRVLFGHSFIQTTQCYQHLESNDVSPRVVSILNQQNVERNRSKLKVVGGKK
jgi:hypothetical protein